MSLMKKDTASGVITLHTLAPSQSEACTSDVKESTQTGKRPSRPSVRPRSAGGRSRAGKRDQASPSGPRPGATRDRLSHTSLRRLQAKVEAEIQEAREIITPLLDTEKGFVKELERFLSQRDVTELRRKELLHKRWTERVWFPLQRRVEERASSLSPAMAKRRQGLYTHYLCHCNTKGFVFLETYDLKEYNPFLLNIKKPHCFKPKQSTADSKDSLYRQLHESLREKGTACSCEAGCKYMRRKAENLPQSDHPFGESAMPRDDATSLICIQKNSTGGWGCSKEEQQARHGGRCGRTSCRFFARGCRKGSQ